MKTELSNIFFSNRYSMKRVTDARRKAFEAMMSKEEQRSNRDYQEDQKYQQTKKPVSVRGNERTRRDDDTDTSSSSVRVPTSSQSRVTASSSLSNLCNDQAEEIRMLYEQLNQRELDLKEMRYEYINAVKENKAKKEGNDTIDENLKNQNQNVAESSNVGKSSRSFRSIKNENEVDDSNLSSDYAEIIPNLPRNSRSKVLRNSKDFSERKIKSQRSKSQDVSRKSYDRSSTGNERTDQSEILSSAVLRNSRKKNAIDEERIDEIVQEKMREKMEEKNRFEAEQKAKFETQNSQLLELIEFRNRANTEYEKLRKSFDILKSKGEEKAAQVDETCSRLIRFVTGDLINSFFHRLLTLVLQSLSAKLSPFISHPASF
jgi:hypothetical protein